MGMRERKGKEEGAKEGGGNAALRGATGLVGFRGGGIAQCNGGNTALENVWDKGIRKFESGKQRSFEKGKKKDKRKTRGKSSAVGRWGPALRVEP